MRLWLSLLAASLFVCPAAISQDSQVSTEANQMLEKANGVSLSPKLPNLRREVFFRVYDSAASPREGTFVRTVIQGVGRREEVNFGDYHAVDIWTHAGLKTTRNADLAPPDVDLVRDITPIKHVQFDDDDIIRTIVDRAGHSGEQLRCIQFQTVRGSHYQSNEICVNASTGAFAIQQIGEELFEYSDFFPFAGAILPAKVTYSRGGLRRIDISQTMAELKDATENTLVAPPNSVTENYCKTFKRAIGQSMPEPKEGRGAADVDVAVRGIIKYDGRIHDAVVVSSERPDLFEEALSLIQQWTFTPGVCDGKPNSEEVIVTLHFHGR